MKENLKHWPKLALGMGILVSLLLYLKQDWFFRNDDWVFWVHLPILMFHQSDEYVWPGGFKKWFNQVILKSDSEDFPLTWPLSAKINVIGWVPVTLMAVVGSNWDGVFIIFPFIGIFGSMHNAWFHISYTVSDQYSPGTITSLLLYLPLTFYASYQFYSAGNIEVWELCTSFVIGGLLHRNIFHTMRNRMPASNQ